MRTSEFIEKVYLNKNIIGLEIEDVECFRLISKRRKTLARVSKSKELEIDTDSNDFSLLPKKEKEDLFSLIVEYAMTPLEEREEPKKYKLKHKLIKEEGEEGYLNYIINKKELIFSTDAETRYTKATATIQEWESLTEQTWEDLLLQFKAIEV